MTRAEQTGTMVPSYLEETTRSAQVLTNTWKSIIGLDHTRECILAFTFIVGTRKTEQIAHCGTFWTDHQVVFSLSTCTRNNNES